MTATGKVGKAMAKKQMIPDGHLKQSRDFQLDGSSGDSSAELTERSDQLRGRSDSNLDSEERRQSERRSELRVVCQMMKLFARVAGFREYKLTSSKGNCQELSRFVPRFQKSSNGQMRPIALSGCDPIAVSFLEEFKDVCSLNCFSEETAKSLSSSTPDGRRSHFCLYDSRKTRWQQIPNGPIFCAHTGMS